MFQTGRISGVLLPVFSLRSQSDFGIGDFGAAEGFFRWMGAAGQRLWMMLPLLPTAPGDVSPYATRCAFGLNPLFIHVDSVPEYQEAGGFSILDESQRHQLAEARASHRVQYHHVFPLKWVALGAAFDHFEAHPGERRVAFEAFWREQAIWLDSYALYAALAEDQRQRPWWEWPTGLRQRQPAALDNARKRLGRSVRFHAWLQFVAHEQWGRVRAAASAQGILLCGDEPFITGQDSADAWANPGILRRDARLGVPPDDFSSTGQDWGLPYFDFGQMERDGWSWLLYRARQSAAYYDLRRVDHAVGYFRQWVRDVKTPTGRFVPPDEPSQRAQGERLFGMLAERAGIVAEDLGVIPPWVRETLTRLGIPGFRVLRWEKDEEVFRDPHAFPAVSLATTGTHDTETMREWWEAGTDAERAAVADVWKELGPFRPPPAEMTPALHAALLAAAENAASDLCVLPWQDILGSTERINLPGSVQDANWAYRISQPVEELLTQPETEGAAALLRQLTAAAGRA